VAADHLGGFFPRKGPEGTPPQHLQEIFRHSQRSRAAGEARSVIPAAKTASGEPSGDPSFGLEVEAV